MSYQDIGYKSPVEYTSLIYLHTYIGDVTTVEYICNIWNKLHQGDTLRILRVNNPTNTIVITGKCVNTPDALDICRYLTTVSVDVCHEKTIRTETWEV